LHERATMLHYTYVAYLVVILCHFCGAAVEWLPGAGTVNLFHQMDTVTVIAKVILYQHEEYKNI
jgi:ABC-type antimicrobial peptide transport system permease subunit